MPSLWVVALCEASDGTLWLGTDDKGLVQFDGTSFKHYTTAEGLLSTTAVSPKESLTMVYSKVASARTATVSMSRQKNWNTRARRRRLPMHPRR